MSKTFRECPSKNFFTRAIQSATKLYNNEKDAKCEIKKKDVSFELETIRNGRCFIKRIDQVSILTAQIELLLNFNLEGLVSKN